MSKSAFDSTGDSTADAATPIQPIGEAQQQRVVDETCAFIRRAEQVYEREFDNVPVAFDLRGRAAGMYVVSRRGGSTTRKIRYNPWLFAKYFDENLKSTVPHEVAHYIVEQLHRQRWWRSLSKAGGSRRPQPHGPEWRGVMDAFGADASVTSSFDMSGIPCRKQQTVSYRCRCREHPLGIRRHNKVQRGQAQYLCRYCGEQLVLV